MNFKEVAEKVIASGISIHDAQRLFTAAVLQEALAAEKGNQCAASKRVHVHRNTFTRMLPREQRVTIRKQFRKKVA
jgi:DNA-binding NtrC family response regulator